jgi:hypothetical protein
MFGLMRPVVSILALTLLGVLSSCACSCGREPTAIELQVSSPLITQGGDLTLTARTWGPLSKVAFYTQVVPLTKTQNGSHTYRSVALDSSGLPLVSFEVQVRVEIP